MDATQEFVDAVEANIEQETDALRELSLMELSVVGGGSAAVCFM